MQVFHKRELQLLLLLLPLFLLMILLIGLIDLFDLKRLFKYRSYHRMILDSLIFKQCRFFYYIFSFDQQRFIIITDGLLLMSNWFYFILEVKPGNNLCSNRCRGCSNDCSLHSPLKSTSDTNNISGSLWMSYVFLITTTLWKLFHWDDWTHFKWRILLERWAANFTSTDAWLLWL